MWKLNFDWKFQWFNLMQNLQGTFPPPPPHLPHLPALSRITG